MDTEFKTRFWEIDSLRGIAITLMIISNLFTVLDYFNVYNVNFSSGFFFFFSRTIAVTFLLLVGISLTLSYSKIKDWSKKKLAIKYIKRGFTIFSWGLAITLVSWVFIREALIRFGVLHLIGLSIILAIPFIRKKYFNLVLGAIFILVGLYIKNLVVNTSWLIWLGLSPSNVISVDYFPIFPWFGVILIGIFLGNILYENYSRQFTLPDLSKKLQVLTFLGRNSLVIYLLHQPIIISILYLLGYIAF